MLTHWLVCILFDSPAHEYVDLLAHEYVDLLVHEYVDLLSGSQPTDS